MVLRGLRYLVAQTTGILMPFTPGIIVLRVTSVLILIAALVSLLTQVITFNFSYDPTTPVRINHTISPNPADPIILNDRKDHVFVFMQVSDLHLSINFDARRGPDFEVFCSEVVDTVRPSVTLVTGDLTDARTKRLMAGEQYEWEWQEYQRIVRGSGVVNKTMWLDIRGNHDDFGVMGPDESNNYYTKYSVQGKHGIRSHFSKVVGNGTETYAFVAVDACLTPGPNRPFNTVGFLRRTDISILKDLKHSLPDNNMTIWFGHYPTRAITGPGHPDGLTDLIHGPYLSGHIHMMDLYAVQGQGFLDAELADWRTRRFFRVAAVDHGIFSFTDVKLKDYPIILITNPKPAQFLMPVFEPVSRIRSSTHVRVLIFSPNVVTNASMRMGEAGQWIEMTRVPDSDLFVAPWDPEQYLHGLHKITVKAKDAAGNERNVSHVFSFDGSRPVNNLKSKLIMKYPHQTTWGLFFVLAVVMHVVPLMGAWLLLWLPVSRRLRVRASGQPSSLQSLSWYQQPIAKILLLASVHKIFLPVVCMTAYLSVGPWMVAEVIPGHYAVCFVFGMWVEGGYFLPGGVSYVLAALQVLLVHVPFTIVLSHAVHVRYRQLTLRQAEDEDVSETPCQPGFHCRHVIAWLVLAVQFFLTIVYADAYGIVAWITGFSHTWILFLNIHLWNASMRLQAKDFSFFPHKKRTSVPQVNDVGMQETTDLLKERTD